MRNKTKGFLAFLAMIVVVQGCLHGGGPASKPCADFTLTIAHLNDSHSHLDPVESAAFPCGAFDARLQMGGIARVKTAVDALRDREKNLLFLHAGDALQGTLYFVRYLGEADAELLNLIGLDAMTLGNHEFDRGTAVTGRFVSAVRFPIVSSNIDVSGDPNLRGRIAPYVVKSLGDEKVAVIGAILEETPVISNPGPDVVFTDAEAGVERAVRELAGRGVNKVIVLSHQGYREDLKMAREIPGIDVIVGGHSHTLLGGTAGNRGAFEGIGLRFTPEGDYPTVVQGPTGKRVLVVQAWEWLKVLGLLKVSFDDAGDVQGYEGEPEVIGGAVMIRDASGGFRAVPETSSPYRNVLRCLPAAVRIYAEDPVAQMMLSAYAKPIEILMKTKVARAATDMIRAENRGPGPVVADSMRWKTAALARHRCRVAVQNAGGIRADIPAGEITAGTVYTVLPFGNTLVVMDLSGRELKAALEEGADRPYGHDPLRPPPSLYVSGATFRLDREAPKGSRISGIMVDDGDGRFIPLTDECLCSVTTNSFIARGGDGNRSFATTRGYRYDTGFIDAEVFMEYLRQLPEATVIEPAGQRIKAAGF
ncbi:MAG: 5'-nucleotidase C-terminal domain-containing protein [Deltaproteobacteria bacterium]|nr:5'-nucleotidase C-terminal domain-containing protein [Deltaproteobacteria bacterium]